MGFFRSAIAAADGKLKRARAATATEATVAQRCVSHSSTMHAFSLKQWRTSRAPSTACCVHKSSAALGFFSRSDTLAGHLFFFDQRRSSSAVSGATTSTGDAFARSCSCACSPRAGTVPLGASREEPSERERGAACAAPLLLLSLSFGNGVTAQLYQP